MRNTVISFIAAEFADLVTTIIGLRMGAWELNPISWEWLMPAKVFAVILISFVLQYKNESKLDWLIVGVAAIPVAWNLVNIIISL